MALGPARNYLFGPNGAGKTSLLETIHLLGRGRSFRTRHTKQLARHGAQAFSVSGTIADSEGTKNRLSLQFSDGSLVPRLDGHRAKSMADLAQKLPVHIIEPNTHSLIEGPPSRRRGFLDWGVFHVEPAILQTYRSFNRALKNINTLFSKGDSKQVDFWLFELATLSVEISSARTDYIERLCKKMEQPFFLKTTNPFSSNKAPSLLFSSGWTKETSCLDQEAIYGFLKKNITSFTKAKHLNYGPHKATIDFFLNNQTEHHFSRGEQKSLSIMFWVAQVLILVETGVVPVVLIDDVSSELDKQKTNWVLDCLLDLGVQVFLTNIGKKTLITDKKKTNSYKINSGVIKEL